MNISELRSETSRVNGAKSKGPVAPEGRAKSAQNSNRHGLTIRGLKLHTQSDEAVKLILDEYEVQHQPEGPDATAKCSRYRSNPSLQNRSYKSNPKPAPPPSRKSP